MAILYTSELIRGASNAGTPEGDKRTYPGQPFMPMRAMYDLMAKPVDIHVARKRELRWTQVVERKFREKLTVV